MTSKIALSGLFRKGSVVRQGTEIGPRGQDSGASANSCHGRESGMVCHILAPRRNVGVTGAKAKVPSFERGILCTNSYDGQAQDRRSWAKGPRTAPRARQAG